MTPANALRAYANAADLRSDREREADVFLRVNAALRQSMEGGPVARAKALADMTRLWNAVVDAVRDPRNLLADPLKASIISVGLAVQREIGSPNPDFDFLMTVNENMAGGLTARPAGG